MSHLLIDTSTKNCSLFFSKENKLIYAKSWISENNHSEELNNYFTEIKDLIDNVDYLGVLTGPGGFNSIRIGISFALAISISRNIKMLAIPTHLVQAIDSIIQEKPITSVIQCGKNMTSWAEFKDGKFVHDNFGITKDEIYKGEKYCGETSDLANNIPRPYEKISKTADLLIEKFGYTKPEDVLPIYAKEPSISIPKEPYKKFNN